MPLAIQQKVSVNESTKLSAENENVYDKRNVLQPYAIVQPLELHRHFANFFSTGPIETRSLPRKTRLMLTKSATYSPESETIPNENQAIISLSRSLQNINDNGQSLQDINDNGQSSTLPADLDAPTRTLSQDNFLQVPAMATNAMITTTSHDSLPRPKSTSFIDTTIEEIYDNVCDLVSPKYCTLPSG